MGRTWEGQGKDRGGTWEGQGYEGGFGENIKGKIRRKVRGGGSVGETGKARRVSKTLQIFLHVYIQLFIVDVLF